MTTLKTTAYYVHTADGLWLADDEHSFTPEIAEAVCFTSAELAYDVGKRECPDVGFLVMGRIEPAEAEVANDRTLAAKRHAAPAMYDALVALRTEIKKAFPNHAARAGHVQHDWVTRIKLILDDVERLEASDENAN